MVMFFRTLAATPLPSWIKPSRMCSVPMYSWLNFWASCRAKDMTFLARSVKRSNMLYLRARTRGAGTTCCRSAGSDERFTCLLCDRCDSSLEAYPGRWAPSPALGLRAAVFYDASARVQILGCPQSSPLGEDLADQGRPALISLGRGQLLHAQALQMGRLRQQQAAVQMLQ